LFKSRNKAEKAAYDICITFCNYFLERLNNDNLGEFSISIPKLLQWLTVVDDKLVMKDTLSTFKKIYPFIEYVNSVALETNYSQENWKNWNTRHILNIQIEKQELNIE
jgi:hypothetical protein